jgi:hypothetical protein
MYIYGDIGKSIQNIVLLYFILIVFIPFYVGMSPGSWRVLSPQLLSP